MSVTAIWLDDFPLSGALVRGIEIAYNVEEVMSLAVCQSISWSMLVSLKSPIVVRVSSCALLHFWDRSF